MFAFSIHLKIKTDNVGSSAYVREEVDLPLICLSSFLHKTVLILFQRIGLVFFNKFFC